MTPMSVRVGHGAATHAGLRGRANEDSYLADAPVFVVADGMGGHEAGARASAAAVAEFQPLVGIARVTNQDVRAAIERARSNIDALATGQRAAGTTLTGVVLTDRKSGG